MKIRGIVVVILLCLYIGQLPAYASAGEMDTGDIFNVISTGWETSAAIDDYGYLYTWGKNDLGQLGLGDTKDRNIPTRVAGPAGVICVSMGEYHGAAVTGEGSVYIWGMNTLGWNMSGGLLGTGSTMEYMTSPTRVPGLSNIKAVACGYAQTLALSSDGYVYCWGFDSETGGINAPTRVGGLSNVVAIAEGTDAHMALTKDGNVYAWGNNFNHGLGLGANNERVTVPTKVPGLSNVTYICAGAQNGAAVSADGSLYIWGTNMMGSLYETDYTPRKIADIPEATAVSIGTAHCLILTKDGEVYGLGYNYSGQLGVDYDPYSFANIYASSGTEFLITPERITPLDGITAISAGASHSLALNEEGFVFAWGSNSNGELGTGEDNETWSRYNPEAVMTRDGRTYISIDVGEISLYPDENYRLGLNVIPFSTRHETVRWSSSDRSVASVDSSGLVRAVGAGSALITATVQNGAESVVCTVTVMDKGLIVVAGALESSVYYTPVSYASMQNSRYLGYATRAGGKKDFLCGGLFCVAYEVGEKVKISSFDADRRFVRSLYIDRELEDFGAATGDGDGNIYILWGEDAGGEDASAKSRSNVWLMKYSGETGKKLGGVGYISGNGDRYGTKLPFDAGNASLAINGDIIAAHFGRQMFQSSDGLNHQSSTVVYADKNTMKPVDLPLIYTSHSFDQQVLATSDGGFLFADHGDAYPRAFNISYVNKNMAGAGTTIVEEDYGYVWSYTTIREFASFHFTQMQEGTGASPGYAYNYTLAHMGGVAETDSAYIFAASSVRTLNRSLPVSGGGEPRDVFIQILKKDFWDGDVSYARKNDEERFRVEGETRGGGSGPSYTDYGVIWLTSLPQGQLALSPKICAIGSERIAVLWEVFEEQVNEWGYSSNDYISTFYTVIQARTGQIIKPVTELPGARLPEYDRPVYYNGRITWSTTQKGLIGLGADVSPGTLTIYSFDVDSSPTGDWNSPYDDVDETDWFGDSVRFATENGLMNGISESTFNPDGTLTRAMVAAVLYRMAGSPEQVYSEEFSDVRDLMWYTPAVLWAFRNGIATGYGNNTFHPEDSITREQFATMLYRYEALSGNDISLPADFPGYFYDIDTISSWAYDAMAWAVADGLISGVNEWSLGPGGNTTRAQCATILARYILRI